jgi:hypothetical protein
MSQLVLTVGTLSVFGFNTPVPYVGRLQVLGKEADENLGAVVMELEKHLC